MQPFPHPSDATHKIWSRLANWFQRYSSLKVWTTDDDGRRRTPTDDDGRRRTDDGPLVYYKLTLWAFGSGELKKQNWQSLLIFPYFFVAGWVTQITQLGYLNWQKCKKGYIFHKKMCFTGSLKRGMIFQFRDHSDRVVFQRFRMRMLTQEKSECSPHPKWKLL